MSTPRSEEFTDAVREHAETVLEAGRDRYGEVDTPLLADAIDTEAGEAARFDGRDVQSGRRLSNVAFQQAFLRVLVALTELTGEDRYREGAIELTEWTLENLRSPAGLLYWGGHVAYDLEADELATHKGGPHELKFEYPHYELLYEVDPDATRRFVEAFWEAHVNDWSILDFNRHGDLNEWASEEYDYADAPVDSDAGSEVWNREYEGGDVFFWGSGLTFVNTGSDLYYAAGLLSQLDGDDAPREWSERLARRYVETRQEPGISGYQFSQHPSWCNGPQIRGDRAQYQFAPYIPGDHRVFEGTLFRPRPIVQRRQLELGERLGGDGDDVFTRWALEELLAWRETAYRPADNTFEPMLTDGLSLEGFVIRREGYFGPKGRIVGPIEADAAFLWTYAQAARTTGDRACWETARDIAAGLGFGELGSLDGSDPEPDLAVDDADPPATDESIHAMLECYRATDREAFLDAAAAIGTRILANRELLDDSRVFTDDAGRVRLDDPVPLALARIAGALRGMDPSTLPHPIGRGDSPSGGI